MSKRATEVTFFVPGKPAAQPRQRHRIVNAKNGRQFVQTYNPASGRPAQLKRQVSRIARGVFAEPFSGPVKVGIVFHYAVKSKPQFFREKKPDIDNLCKLVLDGMNGIAYADDNQVATLVARKTETTEAQREGILVRVSLLTQSFGQTKSKGESN